MWCRASRMLRNPRHPHASCDGSGKGSMVVHCTKKKHRSTYIYLQILQEDETKNWLAVSNIFPECVAKGSRSFCCAHVAVSMGEAAKPRSFCCAHVAVSMGKAAKPQSLLVLWHRRVYGGSCKTSFVLLRSHPCVYLGSCKTSVSACPLASPCLWGKLQNLACFAALTSPCLWGKLQSRVYKGSCKTSLVLLRRVSAFPRLCASFVVQSKTGTCFVQAL